MNPDDLAAGQVWELSTHKYNLAPSVLLDYHAPERGNGNNAYWRCLCLLDGSIFIASVHRWERLDSNEMDPDPIVGARLA